MRFYQLLPSIYHYQDERHGHPLQAYLSVMEETYVSLEEALDQYYENCFIETCEPWVISYIGRLVGLDLGPGDETGHPGPRSLVADALANRRRKGTHASLEKLLAHSTGWGVCVSEGTNTLAKTHHMATSKPGQGSLSLRANEGAWLGTSFERSARTIDIRASQARESGSGMGPTNIAIHIWRLKDYRLTGIRPAPTQLPGCFTFSPIGLDLPLFKTPIPWADPNFPADIGTVPGPLLDGPLRVAAKAFRTDLAMGRHFEKETLKRREHFRVLIDGSQVPDEEICYMDLSGAFNIRRESGLYRTLGEGSIRYTNRVAVDVNLGRIAFSEDMKPERVSLDYSYGAVSNLGGGPYNRRDSLVPLKNVAAFISHKPAIAKLARPVYTSLKKAIEDRSNNPYKGTIRIIDNGTYLLPEGPILLPDNAHLHIEAANGARPSLVGDLHLRVVGNGAKLSLNGVLLDGSIRVENTVDGSLELAIEHTTLVPKAGRDSLTATLGPDTFALNFTAKHSICGAIRAEAGILVLQITDSIVDGGISDKLQDANSPAYLVGHFERATVLGASVVRELTEASDSIFAEPIIVRQRDAGQVRYSYFSEGSRTPPAFRCIREWQDGRHILPRFSSTRYGDPAYCRLGDQCLDLLQGAENGSEIGVWHHLGQARRLANLQSALENFLPFGMEPVLHFVT